MCGGGHVHRFLNTASLVEFPAVRSWEPCRSMTSRSTSAPSLQLYSAVPALHADHPARHAERGAGREHDDCGTCLSLNRGPRAPVTCIGADNVCTCMSQLRMSESYRVNAVLDCAAPSSLIAPSSPRMPRRRALPQARQARCLLDRIRPSSVTCTYNVIKGSREDEKL